MAKATGEGDGAPLAVPCYDGTEATGVKVHEKVNKLGGHTVVSVRETHGPMWD